MTSVPVERESTARNLRFCVLVACLADELVCPRGELGARRRRVCVGAADEEGEIVDNRRLDLSNAVGSRSGCCMPTGSSGRTRRGLSRKCERGTAVDLWRRPAMCSRCQAANR